ncbi:MAG: hypothetical protein JNM69_19520 [Archangium sp.]|nr:hypothetical protein [Archangium sp.]
MNEVLAPAAELEALLPELRRRAQSLALAPKLLFGRSGEALLLSMLFERWPELVAGLSVETRFYNRYFWFLRFVALHTDTHGPDAGLQQQAFQLLESAEFDVDSELLQQIETEAGRP